jgi:hypothetical protein
MVFYSTPSRNLSLCSTTPSRSPRDGLNSQPPSLTRESRLATFKLANKILLHNISTFAVRKPARRCKGASLDPEGVIVLLKELWTLPRTASQGKSVSALVVATSKVSTASASQSFAEMLERYLVFAASTVKKQRTVDPWQPSKKPTASSPASAANHAISTPVTALNVCSTSPAVSNST